MNAPNTQSPERENDHSRSKVGSSDTGVEPSSVRAFHREVDADGVAVLWFDVPDETVNTLSSKSLFELDKEIDSISTDGAVRALVIASRKPGCFIAGADINEIASISDPAEGREKAGRGQSILNKIEDLSIPTVAAIHGVCLGGGAELALCCRYRVAGEGPKFRMGFPEVNLGILPAFGGTFRLPRLIGVRAALDLILTGKGVVAKKALRCGLVDRVVPEKGVVSAAIEVARVAAGIDESTRNRWGRRPSPKGVAWFLEKTGVGRSIVFLAARKQVLARSHGHYPAPLAVLDVMPVLIRASRDVGLSREAETLGRLVVSDVSKNLIRLFFLNEGTKKLGSKGASSAIGRVGVIGAGVMGAGIASLLIHKGFTVRLVDISPEALGQGMKRIWAELSKRVARRRMTATEAQHAFSRLAPSRDLKDLRGFPFIIEAAVEDLTIKQKILGEIASWSDRPVIVATNTSSIPLSKISEGVAKHVEVVGMHFFNPVERMPLVEVMESGKEKVSDAGFSDAAEIVLDLTRRIGKIPVPVGDVPGFLVNRILSPYLGESVSLVCEGAPIDRVDRVMKDFGMPMGPIRLLDEVGLDVAQHVSRVLASAAEGDRFRKMIDWLVERGRLGKKSGRGFYTFNGRGKKAKEGPDGELTTVVRELFFKGEDPGEGPGEQEVRDRLLGKLVDEAKTCLAEGVVADAEMLDLAMIMGTGFPPFRGGLMKWAESKG